MSNIAKWAILVAGFLALIAIILTFPFVQYLPQGIQVISFNMHSFVCNIEKYAYSARSLLNIFLYDFARDMLSACLMYLMFKKLFTLGIKVTTWAFHFIFK